jgi:hypothetical protein
MSFASLSSLVLLTVNKRLYILIEELFVQVSLTNKPFPNINFVSVVHCPWIFYFLPTIFLIIPSINMSGEQQFTYLYSLGSWEA